MSFIPFILKPRGSLLSRFPFAAVLGALVLFGEGISGWQQRSYGQETESTATREEWQTVSLGKSRVGYIRTILGSETIDGEERLQSRVETALSISRFAQKVQMKITYDTSETPSGEWRSFRFVMENPPSQPTVTDGQIADGKLRITTTVGEKTSTRELPWKSGLKPPVWQERALRDKPLKPGDELTLETFDPQSLKPMSVTFKAHEPEEIVLPQGERQVLQKVAMTQSLAPKLVQYSYVDEAHNTIKTVVSMFGLEMITWRVSKAEALKELSGEDVDLAIATLIKTGPIERSLETRAVVYRIALADDDPAKFIAAGPTQSIKRIDPHTIELTVKSIVPPAEPAADREPVEARFLKSNQYLQSEDELVREFANTAAGDEQDPWKSAQAMERWVQQKVRNKNFSTLMASAAETARSLSGDCTEHACLLSAMCRARKLPARVAVGLLYVPRDSAFGGHMWSEVNVNGVWVPLDATLGRGFVAADHIKFLDASFDDDNSDDGLAAFVPVVSALGQMKIEVVSVTH